MSSQRPEALLNNESFSVESMYSHMSDARALMTVTVTSVASHPNCLCLNVSSGC